MRALGGVLNATCATVVILMAGVMGGAREDVGFGEIAWYGAVGTVWWMGQVVARGDAWKAVEQWIDETMETAP